MSLLVVNGTSARSALLSSWTRIVQPPVSTFRVAFGGDHALVDALSGDDQGAAAGDAALDPHRLSRRDRWWPGRAGVADPGDLGRSEWVARLRTIVNRARPPLPIDSKCGARTFVTRAWTRGRVAVSYAGDELFRESASAVSARDRL